MATIFDAGTSARSEPTHVGRFSSAWPTPFAVVVLRTLVRRVRRTISNVLGQVWCHMLPNPTVPGCGWICYCCRVGVAGAGSPADRPSSGRTHHNDTSWVTGAFAKTLSALLAKVVTAGMKQEPSMFDDEVNYPTAVASYDDGGVAEAIRWCTSHMEKGDTLTVWTKLKSNLRNCDMLNRLVIRHSDVEHVTGRGGAYVRGHGPVLMAWPGMDDIGELVRFSNHMIRGLCVITWNANRIRPWVTQMRPDILGNGSEWEDLTPKLDPVVIEAMNSLTLTINHNNTIAAGYEKDDVVSVLLGLHDAGIPMDGDAMQGWALAHGWSGKNPALLAKYVEDVNGGKRPRCNRVIRSDYIDHLRARVAGGVNDDEE